MENKIITLRTVYKVKEYHFQPTKQPNGLNWDFVKPVRVDHDGQSYMVLSEAERNDPMSAYFLPEDMDIVVTEGTTFDLSDPLQYNKWMAIKDNDLIAPMRDARDADGNFLIDGDKKRYGIAELYVDVAGEDSERAVNRRKQILEAQQFVFNDSPNGILTKCRLIGRNMKNAPFTDAQDLLLQEAEKHPAKVIDLYTGQDTGIQLLILDAKERNILRKVNGWYMYGDTNMGATDEAVLTFLKTPMNKPIFDAFKAHVYPEFAKHINPTPAPAATPTETVEAVPAAPAKKSASKK
jgi:hypothetical protein